MRATTKKEEFSAAIMPELASSCCLSLRVLG